MAKGDFMDRVSDAIRKKYSSTFSDMNKAEIEEVEGRQISSADGLRKPQSEM